MIEVLRCAYTMTQAHSEPGFVSFSRGIMYETRRVNSEKLTVRLMATIQLGSCINDMLQNIMADKTSACSSQRTNRALREPDFRHSKLWCTVGNSQERVSKSGQLKRLSYFCSSSRYIPKPSGASTISRGDLYLTKLLHYQRMWTVTDTTLHKIFCNIYSLFCGMYSLFATSILYSL